MAENHTLVPMQEICSEEHGGFLVTNFFLGTYMDYTFIEGFGMQLVKRHMYDCLVINLN